MANEKILDVRQLNNKRLLHGDVAEVIFEHFCIHNGYAYAKPEKLYNRFTPHRIIDFKCAFGRLKVKVEKELVEEIWQACCPSNDNEHSPSWTVDYLTLNIDRIKGIKRCKETSKILEQPKSMPLIDASLLTWVEIKSGLGKMSPNQKKFFAKPSKIKKMAYQIPVDFLQDQIELNYLKDKTGKVYYTDAVPTEGIMA